MPKKIACPNVTRYLTLKTFSFTKKIRLCNFLSVHRSRWWMDDDKIKANLSEKLPPIEIDKHDNWNWQKKNIYDSCARYKNVQLNVN
jgi:hypothetical protein